MQKIHIVFIFLLIFFIGCGEQKSTPPSIPSLLNAHNQQREYKGRSSFELDSYLCDYAQKHADWMAKKNNLTHSNIKNLMNKYYQVGENIAMGQQTTESVMDSWMKSKGHRENILNRAFTKVGFGITYKNGQPYFCTCFGG